MANEQTLSAEETAELRLIVGAMLPASNEYDIPSADDNAIFADILQSLGRDTQAVRTAIGEVRAMAGGSLAPLDADRREAIVIRFHEYAGGPSVALTRCVLQCYYRDDRVMRSLGMEPRPPFPKGHSVEQGDWSLLDVVKARPKMWRDAS